MSAVSWVRTVTLQWLSPTGSSLYTTSMKLSNTEGEYQELSEQGLHLVIGYGVRYPEGNLTSLGDYNLKDPIVIPLLVSGEGLYSAEVSGQTQVTELLVLQGDTVLAGGVFLPNSAHHTASALQVVLQSQKISLIEPRNNNETLSEG